MDIIEGNVWAIVVSGVVGFVLGGLWYGPIFGKYWIDLSGMTPEQIEAGKKKGMTRSYLLTFIGSVVMAGVLSQAITYAFGFLQTSGIWTGIGIAFCSWLGFIAPTSAGPVLWGTKHWKLWVLDNAYYIVSLSLMSLVITSWM